MEQQVQETFNMPRIGEKALRIIQENKQQEAAYFIAASFAILSIALFSFAKQQYCKTRVKHARKNCKTCVKHVLGNCKTYVKHLSSFVAFQWYFR